MRSRVVVGIVGPIPVSRTSSGVGLDDGAALVRVVFDGLNIPDEEVYGADGVQALALATDIDGFLRGLSRRFDFFWPTGEPYFDAD